MVTEELDQDARIALLDEYSSNKRSWAIIALTCVVAIFSIIQLRAGIPYRWIVYLYGAIAVLLSQVGYSFFRYLFYGQMCFSAIRSSPENHNRPYLYRLDAGIVEDVRKGTLGKITYPFHGFGVWLGWTAAVSLLLWYIAIAYKVLV